MSFRTHATTGANCPQRLSDPAIFVASFNRPNLGYRVVPKDQPAKQVLEFVRRHPGESGIVYCASRAAAERVAESLAGHGLPARPYHAGLDAETRTRNQELFLRDEVQIICATIAFGMGINKPNVRWVVHHDLPKNIEGYYQETGRAGRDGLTAECVLIYSGSDFVRWRQMLEQNGEYTESTRLLLRDMERYAASVGCRHKRLVSYFGETFAKDDGKPYTVYTPFFKKASKLEVAKPSGAPRGALLVGNGPWGEHPDGHFGSVSVCSFSRGRRPRDRRP